MLDQAQEKIKNLQLEHNESLTSLNSKISLLQSNLDEKNRQLSVQQDECAALKSAIATQSAASLQLESQVALIKAQKEVRLNCSSSSISSRR